MITTRRLVKPRSAAVFSSMHLWLADKPLVIKFRALMSVTFIASYVATALVAILTLCGCSKVEVELAPPLTLSCGKDLPDQWVHGDVINLLANGRASLANEHLRGKGTTMFVGKWRRLPSGYSISWTADVRSTGQLIVLPRPREMDVNLVQTGRASSGEVVVEMRAGSAVLKCLRGG